MSVPESSLSHGQTWNPQDRKLEILCPVVSAIMSRRAQVLRRWRELYALHLGDARTLSDSEFSHLTAAVIDTVGDVQRGKLGGLSAKVEQRWNEAIGRGVPFAEAMVIIQLFEESVLSTIRAKLPDAQTYPLVHEYAHRKIPMIAEAYLKAGFAASWQRPFSEPRATNGKFHGLVGRSVPMRRLYDQIDAVGKTGATAFIVGETGTGKELVARAIHECGLGPDTPFVAINCSALPERLIESELFGHVRGSFSGAEADATGLFRAANGGTLFLDEITEMGMTAQARLLRTLQERTVRPVGSLKEVPVEVRIIASTNRDPREAIVHGHLREDLYHRLNVAALHVPALRERCEDIEPLTQHFIEIANEKVSRVEPVVGVTGQAMEAMHDYEWPGNVRELFNAVESAATFGKSNMISLDDLPEAISGLPPESAMQTEMMSIPDAERRLVIRTLEETQGNISRAARLLGISRKKLYDRISRYQLGA